MSGQTDFHFMARKMKALNNPIFSNYSLNVFKFPSCLVSEPELNEQGDLLFSITGIYKDSTEFDQAFPAHMHFFSSAFGYCVEADGTATITIKEHEVCGTFRVIKAQDCYSAKRDSKGFSKLLHIFMEFIFAHKRSELCYDNYGVINNN